MILLSTESFRTPEGFDLPKRLLLPDVRTFGELFTYVREWDHATMTSGQRMADTSQIPASVLAEGLEIGPFMSGQIGGQRRAMAVTATPLTVSAVQDMGALNAGRLSWELFEHRANGRVLVTVNHSELSRSPYLAYIDPASVPATGRA